MRIYHPTELGTFAECPRKWHLDNISGKLEERSTIDPDKPWFITGTAFHNALRAFYQGKSLAEALAELDLAAGLPDYDKLVLLLTAYADYDQLYPLIPKGAEILYLDDKELQVDTLRLIGTPDLVFRYDGKITVVDHKTSKNTRSAEAYKVLTKQAKCYLLMIAELLNNPEDDFEFCYNIIIKKMPEHPKLTASGVLSKAKCVTLPSIAEQYPEANVIGCWGEFFVRQYHRVSSHQLASYYRTISQQIDDMQAIDRMPYGIDGYSCGNCSYKAACIISQDDEALLMANVLGGGLKDE